MLALIARFTFVFWLVIGDKDADKLLLGQIDNPEEDILRLSVCTTRCLQSRNFQEITTGNWTQDKIPTARHDPYQKDSQQDFLKLCFNSCNQNRSGIASMEKVRRIQENLFLQLLCRDDRSFTFRIDPKYSRTSTARVSKYNNTADAMHVNNTPMPMISTRSDLNRATESIIGTDWKTERQDNVVYFIRINKDRDPEHHTVYLSDDNVFTIDELAANSTYKITTVAVHASNEYSVITKKQQFSTLKRGYTPAKVTQMQVRNFSPMPESHSMKEKRLIANIVWKPTVDMTCHYNIICFASESEYEMATIEIRYPHQLYTASIENVTFSTEFEVGIRAKNTKNEFKESDFFWIVFRTPSCVAYYNYNFTICPPLKPQGLHVEKAYLQDSEFSLNISWEQPQYLPDYYTLRILDLADVDDHDAFVTNVSNFQNNFHIENITLFGIMYEVFLHAYTPGGNSTVSLIDDTQIRTVVPPDTSHKVKLISAIFAPIFCIVILSLTTFIVCHRRAKLRRYQERCKYFEELEKKAPIDKAAFDFSTKPVPPLTSADDLKQFQLDLEEKIFFNDDAMEIESKDVTLYEVLGEGAFGLVRRGVYRHGKGSEMLEVAVKMLKEQPSIDDVRAFRREIDVMKSVEKHPNIVGIIGHCTKSYNKMMLLTEYCSLGNLLNFLRDEWKYLHELQQTSISARAIAVPARSHRMKRFDMNCKTVAVAMQAGSSIGEPTTTTSYSNNNNLNNSNRNIIDNKLAAFNKSYGYDDICTNSCKCQVNIVKSSNYQKQQHHHDDIKHAEENNCNANAERLNGSIIEIKNCECKQRLVRVNKENQRNAIDTLKPITTPLPLPLHEAASLSSNTTPQESVDNTSYFKCLMENERQQQEVQLKQENSKPQSDVSFQREPLSLVDLLDITKQVAIGMEFLAKNKVVHRDLAARNILVAPDRTIKIADFGLSRDIYQENIYKKTGNGKLPIKWLALESLTHQVYTTQSDVWSFGILLYEIITMGGTPYPAIPTNRLLHMLKTGYRMEKPKNCGPEFYDLMASCWHANPAKRPSFTDIIKKIDIFLSSEVTEQQIETELLTMAARKKEAVYPECNASDDTYLKPL